MTTDSLIQIKGIKEGLLITAQSGSWEDRKAELFKLVMEKESFFSGARVCLDVGESLLRVKEITQLRNQLNDHAITLWAILSTSEVTSNNARALGFEINLPGKKEIKESEEKVDDAGEKAVLVNRTLRAGYRVEAKEHVIIVGDVNPGAEIVSAGNIIIWGKLRGSAIAGVEGDLNAVICALDMKPTQLRIGDVVFPPLQLKGKNFPIEASIKNGEPKIEFWNKEKGK